MKRKIVCIFVLTLLIATAVPVIGMTSQQNNFGKNDYINHQSKGIQYSDIYNKVQKTTKPLEITGTPFYGYVTYDPLYLLTIGPCSFMPTNPGLITSLAPTSSTGFLSGGTWAKGIWYGCECFGDPYIWTINPITGAMTTLGSYDPTGIGIIIAIIFNGVIIRSPFTDEYPESILRSIEFLILKLPCQAPLSGPS